MLFEAFMLCSLLEDHTYLVIELPLKLDFLIIREGSQSRSPLWKGNCNQTHSSKQFFSGLTSTSSSILQKVVTLFPKAAFIYVIFSSISRILIWRPIYRQPVYVGIYIYIPLAPAHSNYRLETKKNLSWIKAYKAVSVRSYTTITHYITWFTCIHKYAMKTHSSRVFPDGCSGHLPREILTT
jgi:hypothetical protein